MAWDIKTPGTKKTSAVYDWTYSGSDGKLFGWDAVFDYCSEQDWEIFSVVGVDRISSPGQGYTQGGTESFRIFCRKPV